VPKIFDLAEKKSVVASGISIFDPYYKMGYGTFQQRCASMVFELDFHSVRLNAGEVITQRSLIFCENANAESSNSGENVVQAAVLVQRHQHQRWIKRDRYESICRHPMCLPVLKRRDDSNAGREPSQCAPKLSFIKQRLSHEDLGISGVCGLLPTILTSLGLTKSGTVQPFRSYSARHCSAN
jgi:hypothetical protein